MKKLIKVLALMLVICCFMFTFACNKTEKPLLELSKARDNLEDREYEVEFVRNSTEMYGVVYVYLEAYANEGEDYIQIFGFEKMKLAKATYKMLKSEQESEVNNLKKKIEFYESILKHCGDEMESAKIDEIEDAIKEIKKEIREVEKYLIGIKGYYVWIGTKGAIEDTH
jgi:hypothetical protein